MWESILIYVKEHIIYLLLNSKKNSFKRREKGYKALNQLFVDALIKKHERHQVDIANGKLCMKFGKLKTTQSCNKLSCVDVQALSQT